MSAGGGKSQSTSNQWNNSSSFIDPTQMGFLKSLWGSAAGAVNPQDAGAAAGGVTGQTLPGLGAAFGDIQALTNPQAQIEAQSQSLQKGLGQLFREEINPAIKGGAIGAGGFGGGRHGVAEGVAAGQIAQAFTQGRGDIVARANQTALGAGSLLPTIAAGMQGQGQAPYVAVQEALQRLAGILGGPTVVGNSSAGTAAQSSDKKFSFGLFG